MNNFWLLLYWLFYLCLFLLRGLFLTRIWIKQFRLFHVMLVNKIRLGIDFMHLFSCTVRLLFWGRLMSSLVGLLFYLRWSRRFIALCDCFSYLFLGKYLRIPFLVKFKNLYIDRIVYDWSSSIHIRWVNPCKPIIPTTTKDKKIKILFVLFSLKCNFPKIIFFFNNFYILGSISLHCILKRRW